MFTKPAKRWPVAQIVIGAAAFFLHYTGLLSLTIGRATPLFLLPLLIQVAMQYGETVGFLYGLVAGLALDSVVGRTVCFNTVFLSVVGLAVGLTVRFWFNRNPAAAAALSVLLTALYYGIYWLVFYLIPNVQGKMFYLLQYALPSAFYTSLLILPLILIPRWLAHRRRKRTVSLR